MRTIIIGAGIGGLATALSLHAAGFREIAIYERATEIRGLGVGINLLPHAVRELTELDVADRVAALGVAPQTLSYYNRFGQRIWTEPRGTDAGYRWPQLSVHRGRLQLTLLEAVRERLGADVVRLGHGLVEVVHGDQTDTARFATSAGETVDVVGDVIVGADGIHSVLRRQFHPNDRGPVWNGLTLWRGTVRAPAFLDGRTMIMAGDGDQKFVAYPLSAPDASGLARLNFIAERRGAAQESADWNRTVAAAPIVELFQEWQYDWLDVPALIASADEILEYPMVDLDPVDRWSVGHATLLGDAAHAMYPNGSNGASQAIIDARTLAFHLAGNSEVPAALTSYEDARRPATTVLSERTRETGPERVMQLAAERAPEGFADIDDVISLEELTEIATGYKRAAGFHPDELNRRASLSVGSAA